MKWGLCYHVGRLLCQKYEVVSFNFAIQLEVGFVAAQDLAEKVGIFFAYPYEPCTASLLSSIAGFCQYLLDRHLVREELCIESCYPVRVPAPDFLTELSH